MDKEILNEYIDACELIKETEQDIRRIKQRRKTIVIDSVKGSMHEFPYTEQNYKIQGIAHSELEDQGELDVEERLLEERKENAQRIKLQVNEWINIIPLRMQRIIRMKVFEKNTWEKVADQMGRGATGEGVKKEYQRFMEEN